MTTQNIFNLLLIFVSLYQRAKNQLIPSVHSSDTVNIRVQKPDWPHPFLTHVQPMSNHKIFDQFLIFVNLLQHAKNEDVSSICSGEILQSD